MARLAGLACVVESGPEKVTLIHRDPCPAWVWKWVTGCLRRAGHLKRGETVELLEESGATGGFLGRVSAGVRSRRRVFRVEFSREDSSRFRALAIRESADFAHLKAGAGA